MSKRTILSRPRTRVYDANYYIGESMYRPALERLNRKYSGRPLSPQPRAPAALPQDIRERHQRAFLDENLDNCRRRAESAIQADGFFDSRGGRLDARELADNFDEETVSRIKTIRASKKVSTIDDVNMESTVSNLNTRRFLDRTDKILDTIGINRIALDDDTALKRRSLRFQDEEPLPIAPPRDYGAKWTALKDENAERFEASTSLRAKQIRARVNEVEEQDSKAGESAATYRAKQSKARLNDLEEEMEAMAERQALREKKAARLKALIAEVAEENDIPPPVSTRRALRVREEQEETAY